MPLRALVALLAALSACRPSTTVRDHARSSRTGNRARGEALLVRFECARCHDGTSAPDVALGHHCVRCHQQIARGAFAGASDETLARWQRDIVHLRAVPSLAGLGARLDPAWVEGFLRAPYAVRPSLGARMPRLALTDDDARDLTAALCAQTPTPQGFSGDASRGASLFAARGCGRCHAFTGASPSPVGALPTTVTPEEIARALPLAPDLAHTRRRWVPSALPGFLRAPRAVVRDGAMPDLHLDARDANDLAVYVLTAPLAARVVASEAPAVRVGHVSYAEVSARVLRRTCWHCHSDEDFAFGEAGPGNVGGFGFAPRGINLASYEGVRSGGLDARGARVSLVAGDARLVAVLRARQREERGEITPGVRGMPLGLPALTEEDIALVARWVEEGAPLE